MEYEQLLDLKYNKGFSTCELVRRFPEDVKRVSEVALLEIPDSLLKEICHEKNVLKRLKGLRRKLMKVV